MRIHLRFFAFASYFFCFSLLIFCFLLPTPQSSTVPLFTLHFFLLFVDRSPAFSSRSLHISSHSVRPFASPFVFLFFGELYIGLLKELLKHFLARSMYSSFYIQISIMLAQRQARMTKWVTYQHDGRPFITSPFACTQVPPLPCPQLNPFNIHIYIEITCWRDPCYHEMGVKKEMLHFHVVDEPNKCVVWIIMKKDNNCIRVPFSKDAWFQSRIQC